MKRHAQSSNDQHSLSRTRRVRKALPRASQACDACATAKARCDNNEICQRCCRRKIPCVRVGLLDHVSSARLPGDDWSQPDPTIYSHPDPQITDLVENPETLRMETTDALCSLTNVTEHPPPRQHNYSYPEGSSISGADMNTSHPESLNYLADLMFPSMAHRRLDDSYDAFDFASPIFPMAELDLSTLLPANLTSSTQPNVNSRGDSPHEIYQKAKLPEVVQAFKKTVGRWDPDPQDHRAAEAHNLLLEPAATWIQDYLAYPNPLVSEDRISSDTRDRILSIILDICDPKDVVKLVSTFPTVDVLDRLLHRFYIAHAHLDDSWIHIPTFRSSEMPPELLAACMSSTAMKSSNSAIRRFGGALHGVLHPYLFQVFEKRIARTRHLQHVQALALFVQIGLWSGNKRRMEIAGSAVGSALTMLRSGRRYRSSSYAQIMPVPEDRGDVLEAKWHSWVEEESFKRLVFHMHIHCSQESLTTGTRTPVSYAELSLPLPQHRQIWLAKSAMEWKQSFISLQGYHPCSLSLSLRDYLTHPSKLQNVPPLYDSTLAQLIVLHAITSMIKEHLQSQTGITSEEQDTMLSSVLAHESEHKRLLHLLQRIRLVYESEDIYQAQNGILLLELLSMHLFTHFEQLEIVAGRENLEEARAVYPLLQRWCESSQARQAVWHAGQVIRCLRDLSCDHFTEFCTIACYQASLCLYIYGAISQTLDGPPKSSRNLVGFLLDAEESLAAQRWIRLGHGCPALKNSFRSNTREQPTAPEDIFISSTQAVLRCVQKSLQSKLSGVCLLPLAAGMCDLIYALSNTNKQQENASTIGI